MITDSIPNAKPMAPLAQALTSAVAHASPGQWPNPLVTLDALSVAECRAGGAGLTLHYGLHNTPFGPCLMAQTTRGLCNLHFLEHSSAERIHGQENDLKAEAWLGSQWPGATLQPDPVATRALGDRLFTSPQTNAPIALRVKGTDFQIQVWRALLAIPFGGLTTYQELATALGRPTAARAVGNAVGRNPVAYLIPCHRVIRASGELGGFRWGLERKAALLAWESSQK